MKYDVDHFIAKFSAIPDDLWTTGQYCDLNNPACRCASGHTRDILVGFGPEGVLGITFCDYTAETRPLSRLFEQIGQHITVADVNDGLCLLFQQTTPKARILAALEHLKNNNTRP